MLDCVVVADVWLRRLIPRRTTPPASRRGDMKRCLWKDESNEKPHASDFIFLVASSSFSRGELGWTSKDCEMVMVAQS
ncbi:hypothetical protein EV126DRAFT_209775 [Verticillium dahliae]|nr:hypothetical protein EV126DRAFT_209775 [Verticillium dahliae]